MVKKSQSTAKKATTKKRTQSAKGKAKALQPTWRFFVVTIGIFVIAVSVAVVMGLLASSYIMKQTNEARLDRIQAIYSSLDVPEDYKQQGSEVFGDKRVYEWDDNRTYSSWVKYLSGDTVSNTVAELDTAIKAAGFTMIDEPYPGSTQVQYHYKSPEGEYIRLSVSSKPYNDAWQNAMALGEEPSDEVYDMNKNAGPAEVIIKVNLDDNNE